MDSVRNFHSARVEQRVMYCVDEFIVMFRDKWCSRAIALRKSMNRDFFIPSYSSPPPKKAIEDYNGVTVSRLRKLTVGSKHCYILLNT